LRAKQRKFTGKFRPLGPLQSALGSDVLVVAGRNLLDDAEAARCARVMRALRRE